MKLLVTAGKQAKAAAAAVVKAVTPARELDEPPAPRDPWRTNERPAEVKRGGRWLDRRRGWFR